MAAIPQNRVVKNKKITSFMGRAPSIISSPAINEQIPLQGKLKMKKRGGPVWRPPLFFFPPIPPIPSL
jgi:hypothetical protein